MWHVPIQWRHLFKVHCTPDGVRYLIYHADVTWCVHDCLGCCFPRGVRQTVRRVLQLCLAVSCGMLFLFCLTRTRGPAIAQGRACRGITAPMGEKLNANIAAFRWLNGMLGVGASGVPDHIRRPLDHGMIVRPSGRSPSSRDWEDDFCWAGMFADANARFIIDHYLRCDEWES